MNNKDWLKKKGEEEAWKKNHLYFEFQPMSTSYTTSFYSIFSSYRLLLFAACCCCCCCCLLPSLLVLLVFPSYLLRIYVAQMSLLSVASKWLPVLYRTKSSNTRRTGFICWQRIYNQLNVHDTIWSGTTWLYILVSWKQGKSHKNEKGKKTVTLYIYMFASLLWYSSLELKSVGNLHKFLYSIGVYVWLCSLSLVEFLPSIFL